MFAGPPAPLLPGRQRLMPWCACCVLAGMASSFAMGIAPACTLTRPGALPPDGYRWCLMSPGRPRRWPQRFACWLDAACRRDCTPPRSSCRSRIPPCSVRCTTWMRRLRLSVPSNVGMACAHHAERQLLAWWVPRVWSAGMSACHARRAASTWHVAAARRAWHAEPSTPLAPSTEMRRWPGRGGIGRLKFGLPPAPPNTWQ